MSLHARSRPIPDFLRVRMEQKNRTAALQLFAKAVALCEKYDLLSVIIPVNEFL